MNDYSGRLISELGVEKYLKGRQDINYSNIHFFDGEETLNTKWDECNFSCHGPAYRQLKPNATWNQTLVLLDRISPLISGVADGIEHQAIQQPRNLASGIARTAEGLHLVGGEKFEDVGAENWAVIELLKNTFKNILEFEINLFENPLMQALIVIINEYVSILPEWVVDEALGSNALSFDKEVDKVFLLKATKTGAVHVISAIEAEQTANLISTKGKRIVGKQIGKNLAVAVSAAIATQIAKKIMSDEALTFSLKRRLVRLRKAAKTMKGGLGGAAVTLLKAQGLLGTAANSSRDLKIKCPKMWHTMRHKLNGLDMIYFLIAPLASEYVDRISLLEKKPKAFLAVMNALAKDKLTKQIFYPGAL